MEQNTTQEKFETLNKKMTKKLDLIAEYINKDMDEFAIVEIWSLQEYLRLEFKSIMELLPGKLV